DRRHEAVSALVRELRPPLGLARLCHRGDHRRHFAQRVSRDVVHAYFRIADVNRHRRRFTPRQKSRMKCNMSPPAGWLIAAPCHTWPEERLARYGVTSL